MFKANLKIEGKEFAVLKCSYKIDRDTDRTGRPANEIRVKELVIQIESSGEPFFWDWMINQYTQRDGEIEFMKRDDAGAPAKVLKFSEAYMVGYEENFDVVTENNDQPMVETIKISPRVIEIGGKLERKWAGA